MDPTQGPPPLAPARTYQNQPRVEPKPVSLFDHGIDGLAISQQREVYMGKSAPENSRTYWVVVRLKEGEEAGKYVWKIAGDSPESIHKRLTTRYPTAQVVVVREATEGERSL